MSRFAAGALAVALLSPLTVAGQDSTAKPVVVISLTLELAAELAVGVDNQVAVLQRRLGDQLDDLGFGGNLDDISLKLNGSTGGDVVTALSMTGSATLSAEVEIIPQLTVSGNLGMTGSTAASSGGGPDPFSGSVGLTFLPLADPTGRDRAELAADSTATDLAEARARAAYRATGSLIDAVSARMELELLVLQQEIAIRSLANTQALYERDRATDQQLTAAEDAVKNGTERFTRAEVSLDRAQEVLAREIGVTAESIQIPRADGLDLKSVIDTAVTVMESTSATELAAGDAAVVRAAQDVRSAQLDLESTHRFTPRLSITASGGLLITGSGGLPNWEYGVGAELTVSPADWDGSVIRDAESDLAFAESEYEFTLRIAGYDALAAL
ncbi:MAG: TolC family protein, partial [Spirochaetia bacterium]